MVCYPSSDGLHDPCLKELTETLKENHLLHQGLHYNYRGLLYRGSNVVDLAVRLVNFTVLNLIAQQVYLKSNIVLEGASSNYRDVYSL